MVAAAIIVAGLIGICIHATCSGSKAEFDTSLIPVEQGNKWGYINTKGKMVIDAIYDDAQVFTDGLALVAKATEFDTIRTWGEDDGDDYKLVPITMKYGYINKKGKVIIPYEYKQATYFSEGLAFVLKDGKETICINKKGKTVFTLKQAIEVSTFSDGLAAFTTKEGKCGYVDKKGNIAIAPTFEYAADFSEGLAAVKNKDGKAGFINKKGDLVINHQFNWAGQFQEGLAAFSNGNKCGYINKKGDIIIIGVR